MPSNYKRIETENIRRRGTDFGDIGELLSEKLYSDPSHFVFELLQNAEDALARRRTTSTRAENSRGVHFRLMRDQLEVRHFGAVFTPSDVKGICDVLNGTKADDVTQIGRFGIGFKSVFSVTTSPEIHSGDEHFLIEGYIRPKGVRPKPTSPGETLFVFPFNHQALNANHAFKLIQERLNLLGARSLLFLRQIDEIGWSIEGGKSGRFTRKSTRFKLGRRVEILSESNGAANLEEWLVYERVTPFSSVPVEVAFEVVVDHEDSKAEHIKPLERSELFVFFPTDIQVDIGFLLNGPFQTTPSRDNIIRNSANAELLEAISQLVSDTLSYLKDLKLLSIEALQAFPLRREQFPVDSLFRPLFDRVQEALRSEELIPTETGGYVRPNAARIGTSPEMRTLISERQLAQLLKVRDGVYWVSGALTIQRAPLLRSYLEKELGIVEFRADSFVSSLTGEFLQAQSDDWIIRLYEYLLTQPALWAGGSGFTSRSGELRRKPILRLTNGEHVLPPRPSEQPTVFLPTSGPSAFPTIRRKIASSPKARKFLEELGLKESDIVDEVLNNVIPRYTDNPPQSSQESAMPATYGRDVAQIAVALDSATGLRRAKLIAKLRDARVIRVTDSNKNNQSFASPLKAYFFSPELARYFSKDSQARFVLESVRHLKKVASELGVAAQPRVFCRQPDASGFVLIESEHGRHSRGLQRFDPHTTVDGLDQALISVDLAQSKFIWNHLVVPHSHLIRGDVQSSGRQTFENSQSIRSVSPFGKLLSDSRWLPNKKGGMSQPNELTLQDLPDGWIKDETAGNALGMDNALQLVVQTYDIPATLIRYFLENKDAQALIEQLHRKASNPVPSKAAIPPSQKPVTEWDAAFTRVGRAPTEWIDKESELSTNIARRLEKTEEEIEAKKFEHDASSSTPGFTLQRKWTPMDGAIRDFLLEQYRGQCQICHDWFNKSNGSRYFEGFYLASRTDTAWYDTPGNVLCLCPTCCAKMMHGPKSIEIEFGEQVAGLLDLRSDAPVSLSVSFTLCNSQVDLCFTQKHLVEVLALLKVAQKFEI